MSERYFKEEMHSFIRISSYGFTRISPNYVIVRVIAAAAIDEMNNCLNMNYRDADVTGCANCRFTFSKTELSQTNYNTAYPKPLPW